MNVKEVTKGKEHSSVEELEADLYSLILYNDDFNTFEYVIECLISICNHDSVQAEQCAYLVHYTGKTDVKYGDYEELEPCKHALIDRGLSAVIEKAN